MKLKLECVLQVVLSKDAGQLQQLGCSQAVVAIPNAKSLGSGDAAFYWPLCQRLHRAVCTVAGQLQT